MTFRYRPGQDPQEQLQTIEKELGIQNLVDVQVDATNSYLYIFTDTKKFRITMVEV